MNQAGIGVTELVWFFNHPMGLEAQPPTIYCDNMKIKISVEVNGKEEGLVIEIDEDKIKKEHAEDPNMKTIGDAIKSTINKVADHIVNQIE
jgi:hypothetical protein